MQTLMQAVFFICHFTMALAVLCPYAVSLPGTYSYQEVPLPSVNDTDSFLADVKACMDAHVAISSSLDLSNSMFEFVFGAGANKYSCIRDCKLTCKIACTSDAPLSCNESRTIWVAWGSPGVRMGFGGLVDQNVLAKTTAGASLAVRHVWISMYHGTPGDWTVYCPSKETTTLVGSPEAVQATTAQSLTTRKIPSTPGTSTAGEQSISTTSGPMMQRGVDISTTPSVVPEISTYEEPPSIPTPSAILSLTNPMAHPTEAATTHTHSSLDTWEIQATGTKASTHKTLGLTTTTAQSVTTTIWTMLTGSLSGPLPDTTESLPLETGTSPNAAEKWWSAVLINDSVKTGSPLTSVTDYSSPETTSTTLMIPVATMTSATHSATTENTPITLEPSTGRESSTNRIPHMVTTTATATATSASSAPSLQPGGTDSKVGVPEKSAKSVTDVPAHSVDETSEFPSTPAAATVASSEEPTGQQHEGTGSSTPGASTNALPSNSSRRLLPPSFPRCCCRFTSPSAPRNAQPAEREAKGIVNDLQLRVATSASRRQLESASDDRLSAKLMGTIAVAVLLVAGFIVTLPDLIALFIWMVVKVGLVKQKSRVALTPRGEGRTTGTE